MRWDRVRFENGTDQHPAEQSLVADSFIIHLSPLSPLSVRVTIAVHSPYSWMEDSGRRLLARTKDYLSRHLSACHDGIVCTHVSKVILRIELGRVEV